MKVYIRMFVGAMACLWIIGCYGLRHQRIVSVSVKLNGYSQDICINQDDCLSDILRKARSAVTTEQRDLFLRVGYWQENPKPALAEAIREVDGSSYRIAWDADCFQEGPVATVLRMWKSGDRIYFAPNKSCTGIDPALPPLKEDNNVRICVKGHVSLEGFITCRASASLNELLRLCGALADSHGADTIETGVFCQAVHPITTLAIFRRLDQRTVISKWLNTEDFNLRQPTDFYYRFRSGDVVVLKGDR